MVGVIMNQNQPKDLDSTIKVEEHQSPIPTIQPSDVPSNSILAGRYELSDEIGSGGMGKVFRAIDHENESVCAVKVMHSHLKKEAVSRKRFEQEAQVALGLSHENIVAVTNFGITELDEPFIVMEYLEGKALSDLLQEQRRLSLEQFSAIFTRICSGLSYAHTANVVHRDMKPSNIMLVGGDPSQVKIVDFGIAKVCKSSGEICPTSSAILSAMPRTLEALNSDEMELLQKLTQTGEVFGSPLYLSPEQCYGMEADCRSEVFSLGCMMFESLTGTAPLRGKNAMETLMERINNSAPSINAVDPLLTFPSGVERIVACALQQNPNKRFQTVADLLQALQAISIV